MNTSDFQTCHRRCGAINANDKNEIEFVVSFVFSFNRRMSRGIPQPTIPLLRDREEFKKAKFNNQLISPVINRSTRARSADG